MRVFYHTRYTRITAIFLLAAIFSLSLSAPQQVDAVATGIFGATKQIQAGTETAAAASAAAALKTAAAGYAATAIGACTSGFVAPPPVPLAVPVANTTMLESCIQDSLIANSLFVMEGVQILSLPYQVRGTVNTETTAQKQTIINILARIAIAALIRSFTNQVIGWIQQDGGENVGFVGDLQAQLRREADIEGANFLNNLTGVNLCGDIGAALKISLRSPSSLAQKLGCTVTDIVANVENFYQDFSQGGWPAFLKIGLEPQNNPYGAYLIALDAKVAAESSARDGLLQKFLAGSGFLGVGSKLKRCVPIQPRGAGQPIGEECHYEEQITLPGKAISDAFGRLLHTDIDFLNAAREIDDAIIAVANALIGKMISSAVSFSRGDEGERDAGPGIFDEDLSNIQLDVDGLAGNSVQEQTENAILSADTGHGKTNEIIGTTQRDLFLAQRSLQPTATLEAQLTTKLTQQKDLLVVKNDLLEIKLLFIGAANPQDIINAGSQLPPVQSRLNQIISQVPNLPPTAPATGDQKTDTAAELRNATLHVSSMSSLLREMQGEVRRLAILATTTPARRIALDAKSAEIDTEVIRLGESRTAIAGALSLLERAATPAEVNTAIRGAIDEMQATGDERDEIKRANALMIAIVPLLKPE